MEQKTRKIFTDYHYLKLLTLCGRVRAIKTRSLFIKQRHLRKFQCLITKRMLSLECSGKKNITDYLKNWYRIFYEMDSVDG